MIIGGSGGYAVVILMLSVHPGDFRWTLTQVMRLALVRFCREMFLWPVGVWMGPRERHVSRLFFGVMDSDGLFEYGTVHTVSKCI